MKMSRATLNGKQVRQCHQIHKGAHGTTRGWGVWHYALFSGHSNLRISMALLAVWRTTLANSFDLQEHVLPSALDMEVEMVADMEMDMVDNKEVHKMMNDVTKDIVGE